MARVDDGDSLGRDRLPAVHGLETGHRRGQIDASGGGKGPSFLYGAAMQWLNPKAWLASVAGIGVYAADGAGVQVWRFAAIYFVVCYLSIACWAYAGAFLRGYLRDARRVRIFNRAMALLLVASALFLVER
ncbi:homoserine/homoserine lactone efflux protein [Cupriavidus gilardii CR3]|nr:homoserine/homoserine lactone efflux protein [Cupriavidus gilardii CR3]